MTEPEDTPIMVVIQYVKYNSGAIKYIFRNNLQRIGYPDCGICRGTGIQPESNGNHNEQCDACDIKFNTRAILEEDKDKKLGAINSLLVDARKYNVKINNKNLSLHPYIKDVVELNRLLKSVPEQKEVETIVVSLEE